MLKCASKTMSFSLAILCKSIQITFAKGGATKGASAGGIAGISADDFTGGHYTQEEMNVALCFLAVILCMFFAVVSCQWYQKIIWEYSKKWSMAEGKRPMPCAPYCRDGTGFSV